MKNPNYVEPLTGSFWIETTDSLEAIVNRGTRLSSDVGIINPYPINATITWSTGTLSQEANLTVSFKTFNPYPLLNGGKVIFYVPKD